jgi:germination protein M
MLNRTRPLWLLTILAIVTSLALVLAACNGDDDADVDEVPTPTEQADPAATPDDADDADEPDPTPTAVADDSTPTPAPEVSPTPVPDTDDDEDADWMSVRVYLVRGEAIGVASRHIAPTQEVATGAMNELLTGTTGFEEDIGLHSEIPLETRLLGINIENGVATVDLSSDFEAGGGSFSMQMRIAQVVFTLTQFETVDAVLFHIDGQPREAIGGEGIMVDQPLARDDFEDMMSAILLESPTPGEEVSSPLRLVGTSNTFEATMQIEIVDNSGLIVYEGFTTATSGTGERGDFDTTIEFELSREGFGSIILFELSARDGSRINIVEIPVDFRN